MKKILSLMVAALSLLALSSCMKENFDNGADEATMTLNISMPDAAATKAYGDGMLEAKNVIIGVFDENGVEKFRKVYVWGPEEFSKEVQIRFVMGKSYQLVLWAQYGEAYGKPATMSLDEITLDYAASNREELDAFHAYVPTFKVTQDFTKSITLKRPFAQLNFATTVGDMDESIAAGDLGIHNMAAVTIKNVANTLNLFTGEATYIDENQKSESMGKAVVIPETAFPKVDGKYPTIEVDGKTYEVISMNYVLVADAGSQDGKTTVDLTLQVGDLVIEVPGANMKRNWRTNVIGELLTAEGTFTVTIDPIFDGTYDNNWNEGSNNENENPDQPDQPEVVYSEWKLLGSHNAWASEEFMVLEDGLAVARNVEFPATKAEGDGEFKVSNGTDWYGMPVAATVGADKYFVASKDNSQNVLVAPGKYDIWFDQAKATVYVMTPGKAIAEATEFKVETPEQPETDTWGIVGSMTNWESDLAMTFDGTYYVAKGVALKTTDEFKFRTNGTWGNELTAGTIEPNKGYEVAAGVGNIKISAAGTYDIYLDVANKMLYVMSEGKTPADADQVETAQVEIYVVKGALNYLYAWDASGTQLAGAWPGKEAKETVTINETEYYKWTLTVAAAAIGQDIQVIFNNNGGAQTVDSPVLKLAEKMYFMTGAAGADGKYAVEQIDEPVVDEPEPIVPAVALALVSTEAVSAEGGNVVVKVTSNVAWTLALNGTKVAEGAAAVTDFEVSVPVAANTTTEVVNHTLLLSDVPAEGAQAATATADFTQSAAQPEEPEQPVVSVLADGTYWIVAGTNYATPLTSNYGYIQVETAGYIDNAFKFTAVEGGYTIQDAAGKYYYQTGTYNSFNVAAEMPAEGAVWTVAKNDDGSYVITNVSVTKSIQYDTQFNSYGSYPEVKGVYPSLVDAKAATERPAPEVPDQPEVPVDGDFASNVEWTLGEKAYSEKATINGEANVSVLKLGTSSVVGTATFTIPAGTSKISFYGVAWNGKTGKLTVSVPSNDDVNLTLKSNTGAANNTPYTMTVTSDDYYEIELATPCTQETTVSLSTVSGATRVILFGIKAE